MHTVNTLRRALGLICLSLLLIQGMGCNKMLAQWNVSSANKRLDESKRKNAEVLTKDLLQRTQSSVNDAVNKINSQDYKGAVASSKEATLSSKELLTRTTELYAKQLREEADYWLKKADLNQAQAIDAAKLTQYKQDNDTGQKYYDKGSYDKSIKVYTLVRDNVRFLLHDLEVQAQNGLKEAEAMKAELIAEGAETHYPKAINDMTQAIAEIKKLVEEDKDFRKAIQNVLLARQKKQEGILKTKEDKSQKQLTAIENLLDVATELGAEVYALQNYKACSKDYTNLLDQFYGKNYDSVLVSAPVLKPRVEDLILETKREGANAKVKEMERAVNNLTDAKARTYLPGRVEQLETFLSQARQLFNEGKGAANATDAGKSFDESKKVSERGLELNQAITQDFNSLAEQEIKKAGDVLAASENVYRRMQDIFDTKISGQLSPDDQRLEDAKHAMKEELRVRLQNSRMSLELSSVKRQEKDFDLAIEMAKQVAKASDDVQQQTYRVVAHNAILDIANELSRLEREGGRKYASSETDKTLKLLEASKTSLKGGKFREAVSGAADTEAQLEILKQELGRVAVSKQDEATRALEAAKESRAEQYQGDSFNQGIVALDLSKSALEGAGTEQAIEKAIQAKQLADEAMTKSQKQWAAEQIHRADLLLEKARAAGSANYAPEKLQKANDLRKNLQALYDQGSYKAAIEVGEQTVEAADAAFYAKVTEAENEIAVAKRYDGWEQEHKNLSIAIVSATNARDMMNAGKYDLGLQHAQAAIVQAKTVAQKSKRKAFESRMAALEKHMETAQKDGAGYYQSKDLAKILSDMNRLHNEFDQTSYEDLSQNVEKLESQLAGVMEMTPDVLKNLVETMQNRLAELENRRAKSLLPDQVEEVERKIKFAQIDFKAEKFRSSFQNARDASRMMDDIQLNLDERQFDYDMNKLMTAFNTQLEKFSTVLNLGTPTLINLATGPQGRAKAVAIMNACSPSDLRTNMNEIGARIRELPAPPTRKLVREGALKMLELAKTSAANFEKLLILDQYSLKESREIIEVAFLQMHQARSQQHDIERALQYPQSELKPRGVERVVTYQGE